MATIHVTREMVEHLLDLPPGMTIVSDMRLRPGSGDDPAALVFEVADDSPGVDPGKSYSTFYEQFGGVVSLTRMLER
jgi:hypothetical protein